MAYPAFIGKYINCGSYQDAYMIIEFIKKVFLIDLIIGLLVTLKYTLLPKATIQYPEKVKQPSERFRGLLRLYRNEEGKPLCIACKMCQRTCPQNCFDIEGQKDESNKMRPVKFDWILERCSFCGFCVEACPSDAIRFSKEFRLSTLERSKLVFGLSEMYNDYDVQNHFLRDSIKAGKIKEFIK
jgi:NADH-quinone oxidoreductase subunit I